MMRCICPWLGLLLSLGLAQWQGAWAHEATVNKKSIMFSACDLRLAEAVWATTSALVAIEGTLDLEKTLKEMGEELRAHGVQIAQCGLVKQYTGVLPMKQEEVYECGEYTGKVAPRMIQDMEARMRRIEEVGRIAGCPGAD